MSCEEPRPGVPEQALVLESYRCGAQPQPYCLRSIHEASGQVISLTSSSVSFSKFPHL